MCLFILTIVELRLCCLLTVINYFNNMKNYVVANNCNIEKNSSKKILDSLEVQI